MIVLLRLPSQSILFQVENTDVVRCEQRTLLRLIQPVSVSYSSLRKRSYCDGHAAVYYTTTSCTEHVYLARENLCVYRARGNT